MSEIRIDVLRDTRGVDDLRAEWNPLLQASATDSIFLSWEWLSTWWEVLGDGHAPFYVTARGLGGELVGVAPLVIGAGRGLVGRHLRTLMVAGQRAETLSEFLDLFVARGREREIVPLLVRPILEHAGRDWDALVFERVVSCSPNLPLVEEELRSAGLDPTRSPGEASPYLPLPSSWSTLFASMSRNFRSQWSNSMNRLARDGEVRLRVAGRDVPLEVAMDRLVELNRARWGATGVSFRSDAYVRFHRLLSRRLHERGALLLVLLDVGDTTVAGSVRLPVGGQDLVLPGRLASCLPAAARRHHPDRQSPGVGHRERLPRVRLPQGGPPLQAALGLRAAGAGRPEHLREEPEGAVVEDRATDRRCAATPPSALCPRGLDPAAFRRLRAWLGSGLRSRGTRLDRGCAAESAARY